VSFRWFTRFNQDKVPHFTALQKAIKAISPETWRLVNNELAIYAKEKKIENGRYARVDTSVGETDIAYSIDARLLNDSVRFLTKDDEKVPESRSRHAFFVS
jgi:hypothetical protein